MEDFIFAPIVIMIGLGVHAAILRRHTAEEGRTLTTAFALHVASAFGQVWLVRYYYGFGDMLEYFTFGVPLAEQLRSEPTTFFPAVFEAFFHLDLSAPIELPGGGSSQSMGAIAAVLLFFLGNSLYASVLALAVGAYVSKVFVYWALVDDFPVPQRRYALMGAMLLPTAVFWSSALLKEPVVMVAIGPVALGLRWFAAGRRRGPALLMVVVGATVMSVIKPYVLMALSISAGVFYFWSRLFSNDSAALKPFAIITAVAIGTGGFALGSRYFGKSDPGSANAFAQQRQNGVGVEGGSNFSLEGPTGPNEEVVDRGIAGELALAPYALFTALFRPLLFEARNAVQLANALEATFLLVLFIQILRERGVGGLLKALRSSPSMIFCAVFTLALAIGTGLASTNMGTLSRYRAPMMPFFFIILMTLRYEKEANRRAAIALKRADEEQSPEPQVVSLRAEAPAPRP